MWRNLCLLFIETQKHLFECPVIRRKQNMLSILKKSVMICFGTTENQEKIAKKYQNDF